MASNGQDRAADESGAEARAVRTRQLWLTAAILALATYVAVPFLTPIIWAAVLAVAEWPLHRRAMARFPNRPVLVSLALTLATALLVILPLSVGAVALAQESQGALDWLKHAQQYGIAVPSWLAGLPLAGAKLAAWWQAHLASPQGANALLGTISAGSILGVTRSVGGEIAKDSALFLVTLVVLATLLNRGAWIEAHVRTVGRRMFGAFGEEFLVRMAGAVRATVNGTVLVSLLEGATVGVGYAVAGVPQPLLFATFTVILAFIPFGAWLAFGLASLILLGSGHALAAALLFGFGAVVMTVGDNLIQPTVIGSAVELPFLFALVGAIGGLTMFGLVGLFIGPVIMAALLLVMREWLETEAPVGAA